MLTAAAATVVALLSGEPADADMPQLDGLFRGIEAGCSTTDVYRDFAASLAVEDPATQQWSIGRPMVPRQLRQAVGTPAVERKRVEDAEYLHVSVPLHGTFRRLPVAGFDLAHGLGNGIAIYWLRIAAPIAAVKAVLGEDVLRDQKRLAGSGEGVVNELVAEGRETLIVCDLSR